jgi:hypothetical protein
VSGLGLGASTGSFRLELLPLLLPLPLASGRLSGVIVWYLHRATKPINPKDMLASDWIKQGRTFGMQQRKQHQKAFHPIR